MPELDPAAAIQHHAEQLRDELTADLVMLRWDIDAVAAPDDGVLGAAALGCEPWPIVSFDTQLALRRYLIETRWRNLVVLARGRLLSDLPVDLSERAHERRARPVTIRDALHAATPGLRWPEEVAWHPFRALAESTFARLVEHAPAGNPAAPVALDGPSLRRLVVTAQLGFSFEGRDPVDVLVEAFRRRLVLAPDARDLAELELATRYGPDADLLAWVLRDQRRSEQFLLDGLGLLVFGALSATPSLGRLQQPLLAPRLQNAVNRAAVEAEFRATVAELAFAAVRALGSSGRKLVSANARVFGQVGPEHYNPVTPAALDHALQRAAEQAQAGKPLADDELERLRGHLFAAARDNALPAVEHATRLVRALAAATAPRPAGVLADDVGALARWYATDGAWGDREARLLRLRLQGSPSDELMTPCQAVLNRWWAWRDELNQRFATAYTSDYPDAAFPSPAVAMGVHQVLPRLVKPLVEAGQRVLLLVLDGCPATDAAALVDGLQANLRLGLAPDGWQTGLALLPTLTEVSRLGLLGGSLPDNPLTLGSADELPGALPQRKAFQQAGGENSRLLLKADLAGGFAVVRQAVRDPEVPVVAVVLNDLDDRYRVDTVNNPLPEVGDIHLLGELCQAAVEAGRTIVLTADHGHTFLRGTELRSTLKKPLGARLLDLPSQAPVPEEVVELAWPAAREALHAGRLALLWRSGAYLGARHAGWHGGCSLEEVVVAVAVLQPGDTRPERPAWWGGAVAQPAAAVAAPPAPVAAAGGGQALMTTGETDQLVVRLGGDVRLLPWPEGLRPLERQALQALADQSDGRLSAAECAKLLAASLGRVDGALASLVQKLQDQGLDWVEQQGLAGEAVYVFKA